MFCCEACESYLTPVLFPAKKVVDFFIGRTGIWIWKFVANMGYNFFYSALATVIICSMVFF